ncbi:MAG: TIGR01777 family oxidoreductase [Bacteroidales bacterium]
MQITVFGATGFIGKELVKHLIEKDHKVAIVTRNKEKNLKIVGQSVTLYDYNLSSLLELISQSEVIINLAGENIGNGLWTKKRKQRILTSRINIGNLISQLCEKAEKKPRLLIQASATGFYGFNLHNTCNENCPKGDGFLADVCERWEQSTESVINSGIQRSVIRTGIVFGNSGGIIPKLLLPFRFLTSILLGNGNNFLPWIHLDDEIRAIEHIITTPNPAKIYNLAAPEPVTMKDIIKELSKTRNPIIRITIPDKFLILILGDLAKEMLLANQRIKPMNLTNEGFKFKYNHLNSLITNL